MRKIRAIARDDVLITYENEVIFAAQHGESGTFSVIPQVNISIDNPVTWTLDKREAVREISSRIKTQKLLSL